MKVFLILNQVIDHLFAQSEVAVVGGVLARYQVRQKQKIYWY